MAEVLTQNNNIIKTGAALALSSLAVAGSIEQPAEAQVDIPQASVKHHPALVYHVPRPVRLPWILRRIGGCESNGNPNAKIDYHAQNPTTTASGGFQFLDTTWANFRGYRKAKYAPPRIQKIKAKQTLRHDGTAPWASSRPCWG